MILRVKLLQTQLAHLQGGRLEGRHLLSFQHRSQNESSITDQVRVCAEYADRQGWQVVARFEDQGISGAALGNRPSVLALQDAGAARRIDVVLVTDLSRLSRSQGDLSKMIDRFVAKGARAIGVQDGYDAARRGHKLQAGLSGIIGEAFREMVKDRTYTALETRARQRKPTGGRAYGYCEGKVDKGEAYIVREMFGRFADGASCRTIAADLNKRNIRSPGSTWKRSERRAAGWMGSAIRMILRNERYRGIVHWNTSEWRKDPDTGKRKRITRPRSEWITYVDESLRIVSDDLWERAQRRIQPLKSESSVKSGGKPKYLLSGLLRCDVCGAHYVISNATSYGCSTYHDGQACSNSTLVRRDRIERILLGPVRDNLLDPQRVARMVQEMQEYYVQRVKSIQARAVETPQELEELAARIERLRERLPRGDPDMTPDELQAAIEKAEEKHHELQEQHYGLKSPTSSLTNVPRAAELCRRQVALGLDGNPQAALKARNFLREWFGGKIRLQPLADGGLMAHWNQNIGALVSAVGTSGSGGRI